MSDPPITNLTDKFAALVEALRGMRGNDVVSALVDELSTEIIAELLASPLKDDLADATATAIAESPLAVNLANEIVASALAGNIANDIVGSALAGNIANDIAGSALSGNISNSIVASQLANNIATAMRTQFEPLLEDIYNAQNFWGQETSGAVYAFDGNHFLRYEAVMEKLDAIINAIGTLTTCCAALGTAINGLRTDVQSGNTTLGKIGSNLGDTGAGQPPDSGSPPPPSGSNTYWTCGQVYPLWIFQGTSAATGDDIYLAWTESYFPGSTPGDPLSPQAAKYYGYQDGWNGGTGGFGIALEPGTYRFEPVNVTGVPTLYVGVGPLADDITGGLIKTVLSAASWDIRWEGTGSPNGVGVKICRQLSIS